MHDNTDPAEKVALTLDTQPEADPPESQPETDWEAIDVVLRPLINLAAGPLNDTLKTLSKQNAQPKSVLGSRLNQLRREAKVADKVKADDPILYRIIEHTGAIPSDNAYRGKCPICLTPNGLRFSRYPHSIQLICENKPNTCYPSLVKAAICTALGVNESDLLTDNLPPRPKNSKKSGPTPDTEQVPEYNENAGLSGEWKKLHKPLDDSLFKTFSSTSIEFDTYLRNNKLNLELVYDKGHMLDPLPPDPYLSLHLWTRLLVAEETGNTVIYIRKPGELVYKRTTEEKITHELSHKIPGFGKKKRGQVREDALDKAQRFSLDDKPPMVIPFKNGVFDIAKGGFRNIEAKDIVRDPIHTYNPELGKSEKFIQALRDWLPITSTDELDWALELIAYFALYPDNPFHAWVNLIGTGANGKSVLLNIIEAIKGKKHTTTIELVEWNRFTMSQCIGKSLIIGRDETGKIPPNCPIKSLASGEPMRVEIKGKTPFDIANNWKLIVATNSLLRSSDTSHGMYRRIIALRFPRTFALNRKFEADMLAHDEISRIINTLIPYTTRLLERKSFDVGMPSWVIEAKDEIKASNNMISAWFEETYQGSSGAWPNTFEIGKSHKLYHDWVMQNESSPKPMSLKKFGGSTGALASFLAPYMYGYKRVGKGCVLTRSNRVGTDPTSYTDPTSPETLYESGIQGNHVGMYPDSEKLGLSEVSKNNSPVGQHGARKINIPVPPAIKGLANVPTSLHDPSKPTLKATSSGEGFVYDVGTDPTYDPTPGLTNEQSQDIATLVNKVGEEIEL